MNDSHTILVLLIVGFASLDNEHIDHYHYHEYTRIYENNCSVLYRNCIVLYRNCIVLYRNYSVLYSNCSVLYRNCSVLYIGIVAYCTGIIAYCIGIVAYCIGKPKYNHPVPGALIHDDIHLMICSLSGNLAASIHCAVNTTPWSGYGSTD